MAYAKAEIAGYIARDPELRFTPNGKAVTQFSIPVKRKMGEKEETDWYNIVVWGDEAEKVASEYSKGSKVKVKGRLQQRTYEGKDGVRHTSVEVVVFGDGVTFDTSD
jgi:single-strand DNA-binding protein